MPYKMAKSDESKLKNTYNKKPRGKTTTNITTIETTTTANESTTKSTSTTTSLDVSKSSYDA